MSKEENPKLCPACSAPLSVFSITVNSVEQPAVERCTNQSCEAFRNPSLMQDHRDYIAEIHDSHKLNQERLQRNEKALTLEEFRATKRQTIVPKRGDKKP